MNSGTTKDNGSQEPPITSPSGIEQRSRLRRTLLFAGALALLAMIFVPNPMYEHGHYTRGGYRFVLDQSNTGVALFQLLVNVTLAAGSGALVAQIRFTRRVVILMAVCSGLAGGLAGEIAFVKHSWVRAEEDERNGYARQAALNWRYALQFDKATGAEARIAEREREKKFEEARQRFLEEWQRNARRVIVFHPEVGETNSPIRRRVDALIYSNIIYSQRVDGFELAYQTALQESPPPTTGTTQVGTLQVESSPNGLVSNDHPTAIVNVPVKLELQMRSEHNSKSVPVASLHGGDRVFLEDERFQNNDPPLAATWQKVTTMSGQTGWVNAEYLSPAQ